MEYLMLTKIGNREINEDSVGIIEMEDKTVFLLADGLGGHGYGEIASKEAIEAVRKHFLNNPSEDISKLMEDSFQVAHDMMKKLQKEVQNDSFFKTTMVILTIGKEYISWGHIGDSRLYHFEQDKLIERSMDHSITQILVNTGEIRECQMRHHEDRNKLTRVLGNEEKIVKPFLTSQEPKNENSAFLLCTDGFWEHIKERQMEKLLKRANCVDEWMEAMEQIVIKKGKKYNMDNYSAIAVRV